MPSALLENYYKRFRALHCNINRGSRAPHKPIMLLALLWQIEAGQIVDNAFYLDSDLVFCFQAHWDVLVGNDGWQQRPAYPFYFLRTERFWHLKDRDGKPVGSDEIDNSPSIKLLNEAGISASLDDDLWHLVQGPGERDYLRAALLHEYFGASLKDLILSLPANMKFAALKRYLLQDFDLFKYRKLAEPSNDTYFISKWIFDDAIRNLYRERCAVCRMKAEMPNGESISNPIHILPEAGYYNQDPRNGINLCANHAFVFRHGGLAIGDDYRLLCSSHLAASERFVPEGTRILLPQDERFAPALAALTWHRTNVFVP
jgi:putative restriction endonuclease